MDKDLRDILLELLGDPNAAATQADIAQAAALARQEVSFRQRAGAAAARLRRARAEGADAEVIAGLEAEVAKRTARLDAASVQARAADLKRPQPEAELAQVFGRAQGETDSLPLTAAALSVEGKPVVRAVVGENGSFHLKHEGDLAEVTLQISDAAEQVLFRADEPATIAAGTVAYLDVSLQPPKPEPGPVPPRATMPALKGQSEDVARALLGRLGVTEVEIVDEVGDGVPGIVIGQEPEPGVLLGPDVKVTLTIRRARKDQPPRNFMPGLIGSSLSVAEATLKRLGIAPDITHRDDDGPADIVLDQEPEEGTELTDDTTVKLTVSRKRLPAPETVTVPELIGKSAEAARELLKAAGLRAEIKEIAEADQPAGVVKQDPEAGAVVPRDSTVSVVVNTPPEKEPETARVPGLKGRKRSDAEALLKRLNLAVKVETVADAAAKDQVIGQDPEANTHVDVGSTVKLIVSRGPADDGGGGGRRRLQDLVEAMAADSKAEEAGLDAERITKVLKSGKVGDLKEAAALAEADPEDLRERLKLSSKTAASQFRAILRRALKALG